jgi:hypothetical protein
VRLSRAVFAHPDYSSWRLVRLQIRVGTLRQNGGNRLSCALDFFAARSRMGSDHLSRRLRGVAWNCRRLRVLARTQKSDLEKNNLRRSLSRTSAADKNDMDYRVSVVAYDLADLDVALFHYFHCVQKIRRANNHSGLETTCRIFFIALYTLNMGYAFGGIFRPLKDYKFISHTLTGTKFQEGYHTPMIGNRFEKSWLGYIPVPLPAEFVQGIDTQKLDFERGIESYFRGEFSPHGWLSYYAYTILIKEPLGNLALGLLALFATCFLRKYNASWRDEMIVILS